MAGFSVVSGDAGSPHAPKETQEALILLGVSFRRASGVAPVLKPGGDAENRGTDRKRRHSGRLDNVEPKHGRLPPRFKCGQRCPYSTPSQIIPDSL